jgi:hypothetical protein
MFSKMLRSLFIMTALVFLAATTAIAQKDIRTERVQFKIGFLFQTVFQIFCTQAFQLVL